MNATVYISGPMTGYTDYNHPAFAAAAAHLRAKGYTVVNPGELDDAMSPEDIEATPHHAFLRRDLAVLLDCDLIYTLPGWRHSKGATLEMAVARGCGIDRLKDADIDIWRTFEGEPEPGPIEQHDAACDAERQPCEVLPIFGDDVDLIVDDSMPPNTLRIEHGSGHVDFDVSWDGHEMMLAPKAPRHAEPQPGDRFPNVAYVRDMTGRTADELAARRVTVTPMSPAEVAEAVNARYLAVHPDGRGDE